MTPREKEIALEAAGRSSDPVAHVRKMLEAEAFLRGLRQPFVVWPTNEGMSLAATFEQRAAWHEAQAALLRGRSNEAAEFMEQGSQGVA